MRAERSSKKVGNVIEVVKREVKGACGAKGASSEEATAQRANIGTGRVLPYRRIPSEFEVTTTSELEVTAHLTCFPGTLPYLVFRSRILGT